MLKDLNCYSKSTKLFSVTFILTYNRAASPVTNRCDCDGKKNLTLSPLRKNAVLEVNCSV